jgi:hypothetical protein
LKKFSIFDFDPSTDILPARFFFGGEPASLIFGAKDIVEQATASPAEQDYVQSYHDVTKSVKKKSPLAGLDIINYLNKKDKFKGSLAAKAHLPQPPDGRSSVFCNTVRRRLKRSESTSSRLLTGSVPIFFN